MLKTAVSVKPVVVVPADLYTMTFAYFHGDESRLSRWWGCPNPLLGGVSPSWMVRVNRVGKLRSWILSALDQGSVP